MKLNHDCVRALLLALEEVLQFDEELSLPVVSIQMISENHFLENFSIQEIAYSTQKLIEAGYINAAIQYAEGRLYQAFFKAITYDGHLFLDNIRDNSIWKKVKEKINLAGGSVALNLIPKISEKVISGVLEL